MEARATLNKLRISPRKTRLVVNLIRGAKVVEAFRLLSSEPKKAALPIKKLLQSAVANWCLQQSDAKEAVQDKLYIKTIQVGSGGMIKRIKPASRGRAHRIRKRSANVKLVLQQLSIK